MIFHEIYGCYYRCMEKMIEMAIDETLTKDKMFDIIHQYAFDESHLYIMDAIENQKWQLLDSSLHTPLKHYPSLPITTLEKQWLKAISLDPKMKLFSIDFSFLEDIDPLFTPDDFYIYDQYNDGDPYHDVTYQKTFQPILKAIHEKRKIKVHYLKKDLICIPYRIEYSLKDDKFRLLVANCSYRIFNINKITAVELLDQYQKIKLPLPTLRSFTIEIYNERNALERVMTHFADMQKEAIQISDTCYQVKIDYEKEDETEMIIRVLSFGPMVKVIEPQYFINLIKERLIRQKNIGLK